MRSEKVTSPDDVRSIGAGEADVDAIVGGARRLRRRDLPVDTQALARYLVGKTLVRRGEGGPIGGRIVETEAYVVGDSSCHGFRGETRRNRSLFLERGHAYVYFIYGCWFSINVSGERAGTGAGVLLRALEPLAGLADMEKRRPGARRVDLARGPGRQIGRAHV